MPQMFEALRATLPMALGIAASPSPVIALLILLMTRRARSNAWYFLAGWFAGLLLVGLITLFGSGLLQATPGSSDGSGTIRIILGVLFLLLAVLIARQIPRKGHDPDPPAWLDKLDNFRFPQSFAFGFFFAVPNLKNASLVVTGMAGILPYQMGFTAEGTVLLLFCLTASAGVLVPPVLYFLLRKRAVEVFGIMKQWLIRYRALILFLILMVFGVLWLVQGLV